MTAGQLRAGSRQLDSQMMRLDITGRHVEIGTSLRQIIDKRIAKLERLLNDNAISGQVILDQREYRHRAEIVIHARGDHILRGQGEGTAWPSSVRTRRRRSSSRRRR